MESRRGIRTAGVLFGTGAIILTLVLSFWLNFSDLGFYRAFRADRNDYAYIGKDAQELEIITKDLIRYIQIGGEERLEKHFNEREIHHMRDVRLLILLTLPLAGIGLLFCWLSARFAQKKKGLYRFRRTAMASIGVLLLLLGAGGVWMARSFDTAFVRFHEIFFWNDLWILNPQTDMMIRMLPQDLFIYLFGRILALFLIFCALWMAVLYRRNHGLTKND